MPASVSLSYLMRFYGLSEQEREAVWKWRREHPGLPSGDRPPSEVVGNCGAGRVERVRPTQLDERVRPSIDLDNPEDDPEK